MAGIEFIQKRIAGKEKEIEKLENKLARIHEVAARGWADPNPYMYDENDLRWALVDLREANSALARLRASLESAQQKAESRNVQAILDFLESWRNRVFEFYDNGLCIAYAEKAALTRARADLARLAYGSEEYEDAQTALRKQYRAYSERLHGKYEKVLETRGSRTYNTDVKVADGDLEYILPYFGHGYDASIQRLRADLIKESERKYDFIIERTNAIVGKITDASNLTVGPNGELNGYIIGTNGRASVKTIGAGGYVVQCYHFRTLIRKMGGQEDV